MVYATHIVASIRIQVVASEELCAALDNHVARLSALFPSVNITRSSVTRDWLERAYWQEEQRLRAMEDAARAGAALQPPQPPPEPPREVMDVQPMPYVPPLPPFPRLKRGGRR